MNNDKLRVGHKHKYLKQYAALYVMLIPGILNLIFFKYVPMYGVLISFQNFRPSKGVLGSEWVGLKHFIDFFQDPFCGRIIKNTFLLGIYSIIFSFPMPIIFAQIGRAHV